MSLSADVPTDAERSRHMRTLLALGAHLWPRGRADLRIRLLLAAGFMLAAKGVNVYTPFLYKAAVDQLSATAATLAVPVFVIFAYGAGRLLTQALGELRDFTFARSAQHAQRTAALSAFKHLHGLSLNFHLSRQTGGLSRVIDRGVKAMQYVLGFMVFNIAPTIIEIALVTGILWMTFGWSYAVIVSGTIAAYIAFTLAITDWRMEFRRRMNDSDSRAANRAIDSLLNYETVKYFGNEAHEYQRFDSALAGYEQAAVKSQTTLSLLNIGQGAIIGAGLVSVMLLAAQGVVAGERSIGDFVLVNAYLVQLYLPLNFLGYVYREVKQGLVDMDKMFELLDVEAEVRDAPDARPLQTPAGELVFDDVRFAYNADREILKGVSFRVAPGKTTAIVGPSGAGKSTISRLLYRFYDPGAGSIRIDGQDLRNVTQDSLRRNIGIVPQDTVLFNDNIGYNIQYGRPDAPIEEVERAARLAKIHDFVAALPQGYDTPVGERGLKLSGGEKQRVAIARSILKDPRIMLFDEATSALDSHTEKEIQASLREIARGRTTLVIAHRLSTIVDADEILVLKDGRIAERGAHRELLALNGEYAAMWNKQREAAEAQARLEEAMAAL